MDHNPQTLAPQPFAAVEAALSRLEGQVTPSTQFEDLVEIRTEARILHKLRRGLAPALAIASPAGAA